MLLGVVVAVAVAAIAWFPMQIPLTAMLTLLACGRLWRISVRATVDDRELLVADEPAAFASALEQLSEDQVLRHTVTTNARDYLRAHHRTTAIGQLLDAYRSVRS